MNSILLLLAFVSFTIQNPLKRDSSSTCTGQQYNDIPGFPAYNSGCYPTNYYRTSDLGNTSPDDAKSRCQQQCTADSRCQNVVAQVNKAADSNLYSGTCFFFASGQSVAPRRCADKAYLLEGYHKDNTDACFSLSSTAASKYCSSYLGIPVRTVTTTSTPPVISTTSTITTVPTVTLTVPTTITPTTTSISTATITVTSATNTLTSTVTQTQYTTPTITTTTTSTATMTTVLTTSSTTTTTSAVTATSTSVITSTVTSTSTVTPMKMKRVASTAAPPACVTLDTPATRISAACSCLSVATSTTTSTTTLTPNTQTALTTTTIPTTVTTSPTSTAPTVTLTSVTTVTSSATAVTTTTVTVTATVPAQSFGVPITATQTSTSTVTTTTTSTFTSISTATTTTATATTMTTVTTTTTNVVTTTINAPCMPLCPLPTVVNNQGLSYTQVDATCGTFDDNYNSGAQYMGDVAFDPTTPACVAIAICANIAGTHASFRLYEGMYYGPIQWRCDFGAKTYSKAQISYLAAEAAYYEVTAEYIYST